jgi:hypothetical protein
MRCHQQSQRGPFIAIPYGTCCLRLVASRTVSWNMLVTRMCSSHAHREVIRSTPRHHSAATGKGTTVGTGGIVCISTFQYDHSAYLSYLTFWSLTIRTCLMDTSSIGGYSRASQRMTHVAARHNAMALRCHSSVEPRTVRSPSMPYHACSADGPDRHQGVVHSNAGHGDSHSPSGRRQPRGPRAVHGTRDKCFPLHADVM